MTKVDIVSGFLGAGKTTFIKEMIAKIYKGQKVVLIENEFGEIGIDGGFMKNSGIEVTEMNSGCICCTLVGDFARSLEQVVDQYAPDRIIIEPSGVGKLSDVATAVAKVSEKIGCEINSRIAVVDGTKAKMYIDNFGEFYCNQVEHATTIVLSRSQNMDEAALKACMDLLREHNTEATIIITPWDKLEGAVIQDAIEHGHDMEAELIAEFHEHEHDHDHDHEHDHHHDHDHDHEHDHHHDHEEHEHHHDHDHDHEHEHHHDHDHDHEHEHHHDHDHDHEHEHHHDHDHDHEHHHHDHGPDCTCGCHDHDHEGHHHADEVFDSWGTETIHKFTRKGIEDILGILSTTDQYGTVLRAKGIVEIEDGKWIEFDMVPAETEIRDCSPDYIGKICVIGAGIDRDALPKLFE